MKKEFIGIGWNPVDASKSIAEIPYTVFVEYESGRSACRQFMNDALACAYAGRIRARHPKADVFIVTPCYVAPHCYENLKETIPSVRLVELHLF